MKAWFTSAEILAANRGELPESQRSFNRMVVRHAWRSDPTKAKRSNQRGGGWLYNVSVLPAEIRGRLELSGSSATNSSSPQSAQLWARFESLSKSQKLACKDRLKILDQIDHLQRQGWTKTSAISKVAKQTRTSERAVFRWISKTNGINRADWLACMAPEYKSVKQRSDCNEDAWEVLKSDFLRPEKPSFSACYRRMKKVAQKEGWSPIPSEQALRRKLTAEVPSTVQKMARDGREVAKAIYPAQRRTRSHFHAMEAVNMDGHRLDVFVRLADSKPGDKPVRMHLIALQDLYSNKFVGWRLALSENKETVRLVIGDMVESFGIPAKVYLDNGRAFASKWITGRIANRFRFKIRDEDPQGLFTSLGVHVHWTTPYSGQSKPIERAFRDFCDAISKHPICAGAYTGNKPDAKPENYGTKAIDEHILRAHVAEQIAEHNAQEGRNTPVAKGRSFDQVFAESMAAPSTIVAVPTTAQKSLWLLAADRVKAKKGNGEISIYGNRYWHPALSGWAGKPVTVRFDPEKLTQGVTVYDEADQLICNAALFGDARFDSVPDAKQHSRDRAQFLKTHGELKRLHVKLKPEELADIYANDMPAEPVKPIRPSVPRIVTATNQAAAAATVEIWDDEIEEDFSKGLRLVRSAADET